MGQSRGNMAYFTYRPPRLAGSAENRPPASSTLCLRSNGCGVVAVIVELPESIPSRPDPASVRLSYAAGIYRPGRLRVAVQSSCLIDGHLRELTRQDEKPVHQILNDQVERSKWRHVRKSSCASFSALSYRLKSYPDFPAPTSQNHLHTRRFPRTMTFCGDSRRGIRTAGTLTMRGMYGHDYGH